MRRIPLEFEVQVEGEYIPANKFFWNAIDQQTDPAVPEHINGLRLFLGEEPNRVDITDCFSDRELNEIEEEVISRIKEPREEL